MSMTVINNNNFIYKEDRFGQPANIGDLIVYAHGCELFEAFILGFTPKGLIISTSSKWRIPADEHDAKIYKRWISFRVLESNRPLPEALKPLVYYQQT